MDAINDLTAFIARDGAELVTDSRAVALAFKKRHKNVLRTIDRMCNSKRAVIAKHARLNFEPCSYTASNGKLEPMYRMTAKGLSELAMSFSGDDSREVRIRFLNAFEEVAERLPYHHLASRSGGTQCCKYLARAMRAFFRSGRAKIVIALHAAYNS